MMMLWVHYPHSIVNVFSENSGSGWRVGEDCSWESPPGKVSVNVFPWTALLIQPWAEPWNAGTTRGKGFLLQLSFWLHPHSPAPTHVAPAGGPASGWQSLSTTVRESHFPTPRGHCPQACHMLLDPGKSLCLQLQNTNSENSIVKCSWIKSTWGWGFQNVLLTPPPPLAQCTRKGADGLTFEMSLLYSIQFPHS